MIVHRGFVTKINNDSGQKEYGKFTAKIIVQLYKIKKDIGKILLREIYYYSIPNYSIVFIAPKLTKPVN